MNLFHSRLLLVVALLTACVAGPPLRILRAEEGAEASHEESTGHKAGEEHDAAHSSGHAHAVDRDLSHANGSDELHSPAQVKFDLAIATFLVFALLLLLLGKFAWGPIAKGLDTREQNIATMISTAEKNQHEAELRLKELEARLAAQAEEARQAISAARREGEIVKEKIVAEATAAAEAEKNRALEDIRGAKNIALQEIAQKSVNTAFDLARDLVHREVRPEEHAQLVNESLAKFGNN